MPTRAEISAPLPTCVEDAAWNAWESLSGYSTRGRVRAAVRAGLGVVAGNVDRQLSPVVRWASCATTITDDRRRAVIEHLADALIAVQPGRDVPVTIRPGDAGDAEREVETLRRLLGEALNLAQRNMPIIHESPTGATWADPPGLARSREDMAELLRIQREGGLT